MHNKHWCVIVLDRGITDSRHKDISFATADCGCRHPCEGAEIYSHHGKRMWLCVHSVSESSDMVAWLRFNELDLACML